MNSTAKMFSSPVSIRASFGSICWRPCRSVRKPTSMRCSFSTLGRSTVSINGIFRCGPGPALRTTAPDPLTPRGNRLFSRSACPCRGFHEAVGLWRGEPQVSLMPLRQLDDGKGDPVHILGNREDLSQRSAPLADHRAGEPDAGALEMVHGQL